MKKLLLFVFILACTSASAQHKPVQFGFRGGPNIGWLSDIQPEYYNNNGIAVGGSWGFVSEFFLMEGYTINTGFNVKYINGRIIGQRDVLFSDSTITTGTAKQKFKAKYVEIPLIFEMKTKKIHDSFKIYGQIGFGFGIFLNAKSDISFVSFDNKYSYEKENLPVSQHFKNTRESLLLGAGIEIPLTGSTYIKTGIGFDNCFVNSCFGMGSRA